MQTFTATVRRRTRTAAARTAGGTHVALRFALDGDFLVVTGAKGSSMRIRYTFNENCDPVAADAAPAVSAVVNRAVTFLRDDRAATAVTYEVAAEVASAMWAAREKAVRS